MGKTKKELLRRLELVAGSDAIISLTIKNDESPVIWTHTGRVTSYYGNFIINQTGCMGVEIELEQILSLSILTTVWRRVEEAK